MNSRLESLILRQLADVKNAAVGQAIGHDDTHVSRVAHNERGLKIKELEPFFDSLGLKVIECDGDVVSLPASEVRALRLLARKGLESNESGGGE